MKSKAYNLLFIPAAKITMAAMKLFNKKLALREKNCPGTLEAVRRLEAGKKRIWFHAASMGEFEQAKPLIELIKKNHPDIQVIVTFFSPSGYENQKNYKFADSLSYMPFDTATNVKAFLDLARPDAAVFVRYEIWRNYLEEIKSRKIPLYLICATEPSGAIMKSFLFNGFTRKNYNFFDRIFTVGDNHSAFFGKLGVTAAVETLSDTRYDRIVENINAGREKMILSAGIFPEEDFIVVAGSTWKPDEDIIVPAIGRLENEGVKIRVLYVPHEPTKEHVEQLSHRIGRAVLLSEMLALKQQQMPVTAIRNFLADNHVIVDSIGKLLSLYKYARCAYIGGAFGAGVHSVAEPAGYGVPLACGTGFHSSHDAVELSKSDALTIVKSSEDFYDWVKMNRENENKRKAAGKIAKDYIFSRKGSTEKIYRAISTAII